MAHPADDGGLVIRMHADRQRFEAAWQGQPQGMPETLRALSGVSAGNIVSTMPQDPAELTTPAPVVHPGTMGASGQAAPPRDEFAEEAAEAERNPDPAVEREIYEYGAKETEPPAIGGVDETYTIRPKKKKATVRAKGKATIRAKAKAKPERRLVIGDKKQVIQYSNIIIVALQEALDYDPARRDNGPRPALYIDDDKYKSDIRELIGELRRLNDLLERKSLRAARAPAKNLAKHLDAFAGTFLKTYAKGMAWGTTGLTIGAIATLLYHLGLHDVAGDIFRHLKGFR